MRSWTGSFSTAAVALGLGACSIGSPTDDIQTLWGGESKAEKAAKAAAAAKRERKVPMQAVRSVEIGRTRDGILITANGTAPGLGYSLPVLQARRDGRPGKDGYIEYDLVASSPDEGLNLPRGTTRSRRIRADLPVSGTQLAGAKGIRVMALNGAVQIDF